MKLLLDQNLSRRLVPLLAAEFPGTAHVVDFGLETSEDEVIWSFAGREGFTILTKDSDFFNRSLLRGYPPKVVYVRVGNCTNRQVASLLKSRTARILAFGADAGESLLIL